MPNWNGRNIENRAPRFQRKLQVGILSVTSVKKKPVVVEHPSGEETIAIRPMGMIGLSWDHRAFDGAYSASFLHEVKKNLETRDWGSEL